jgi:SAM-dependent methyltransferase
MRQIPFQGEFDAIVNLFTAFGYFDDAQNQAVLHGVARALKPGGCFLIDVPNIYVSNTRSVDRIWFESDLGPVRQEHTWDPWTGRDHSTFYWTENGEPTSRSFELRSYTSYELIAMLRAAGLAPTRLYGGFDVSDYRCQDSRRLIILATKDPGDKGMGR